jgi:hypothetical protein
LNILLTDQSIVANVERRLEHLEGTVDGALPSPSAPALPPVWLDDSSLPNSSSSCPSREIRAMANNGP